MDRAGQGPATVVEKLLEAINAHDLESMGDCFSGGFVNEWPAYPQRGFRGGQRVQTTWSEIFAGVPDLRAEVPRMVVDGDTVWSEWEISGTRRDGGAVLMRGVAIFGVAAGCLASVRFYLEPVDQTGGDDNTFTRRVMGTEAAGPEMTR